MKINLNISGMSCAACAQRIERALLKTEGINSAVVNLLGEKATIEYDEDKINPIEIVNIIEKTGYEIRFEKMVLLVDGMSCAACSQRVEKALNKVEGVINANVNLTTNKATVFTASNDLRAEELIKAVEKAGYHAEVEVKRNPD